MVQAQGVQVVGRLEGALHGVVDHQQLRPLRQLVQLLQILALHGSGHDNDLVQGRHVILHGVDPLPVEHQKQVPVHQIRRESLVQKADFDTDIVLEHGLQVLVQGGPGFGVFSGVKDDINGFHRGYYRISYRISQGLSYKRGGNTVKPANNQ